MGLFTLTKGVLAFGDNNYWSTSLIYFHLNFNTYYLCFSIIE